jgi:hypothetical protein
MNNYKTINILVFEKYNIEKDLENNRGEVFD